jgi:hypothetical protein
MGSGWRLTGLLGLLILLLPVVSAAQAVDLGWAPIDPDDLKLTDNPLEPGGQAMVLDVWDDVDNKRSTESVHVRIKVLREEGKRYANIEIPFLEKYVVVEDLRARTVSSSGESQWFDGQVIETDIVRAKRYKLHAKTLTLPGVQVGSVIEYAYRLHWKDQFPNVVQHHDKYWIDAPIAYPAAMWEVQRDIFVRHAWLTLRPFLNTNLQFAYVGFSNKPEPRRQPDGSFLLQIENLPAFVEEEAAPPEDNLRSRINAYYTFAFDSPEYYWESVAKTKGQQYDNFLKKSGKAAAEARRLLSPTDTEEQKLRKLYARAQQIRMVSFEEEKSNQEKKREELKENKNVDDVLSRNYAYANEVNLVFLAMAQSAGFNANPISVMSRSGRLFEPRMYDPTQANAMVVEVFLDGKPRMFDPATLYCPFDLLPWSETDTMGLRASSLNPAMVPIPSPPSRDAVIRRKAELALDVDGNLEGDIRVSFEGQVALTWRLEGRNQNEAQRRSSLEDWLKAQLPANSDYHLTAAEDWTKSEGPFTASFHVRTSGIGNLMGQRLLLPTDYFRNSESNTVFSSSRRTYPIYFPYAAEYYDDLVIHPAEGLAIEAVPDSQGIHNGPAQFDLSVRRENTNIGVTLAFILDGHLFPADRYAALKSFYQAVNTASDQQIVFKRAAAPVSSSK